MKFQKLLLPLFVILFSFAAFAQTKNFNRARTFDVQHYTIRVRFDRATKTVFGDTTIRLKPLANGFNTVALDAAGMKYESVRLDGGANLQYRQEGAKLIVALDKSYSPQDEIALRIVYSCQPKKGVYFVDAERRGRTVTRDAQIWTQGEPEEAHHWFPSYDFPDDKATSEKFFTVAADETVVSNGETVETAPNADGTKTVHFRMNVPHSTYLTSFVVGKYVKIEDKYGDVPLGFYVYPGRESIVPKAYGRTKDMFRIFEQLTGIPYPYNKYDQTIVAQFTFGGMENITATTMADTEIFAAEYLPGAAEDLVSHELAHSWFGNLVTMRNWAELWLNEGFATFMEAAYREKMYGRADYIRKVREDAARALADDSVSQKRHGLFNQLARPDDSIFDTTTYQKGGAVVHTLREEIGDEAFWRAINVYLNRHKFGNVETPDLKRAMEEASNRNLDWFFEQWVYKGGFPRVEVKQVYNPKNKRLTLTLTQTQKADAITPAIFVLPFEIQIETPKGTRREKIKFDRRTESFSFKVDAKPTKIQIDKNYKIPLKLMKLSPLETSEKQ
jgi:aminopeptidase N